MKAYAISPDEVTPDGVVGSILCQDVTTVGDAGRVRMGKGHIIVAEDIQALQAYGNELHLLAIEADDVHEDEASLRLARAVCGDGIELRGPVESQTHLRAMHRGLFEVNVNALREINLLPDVSVFTSFSGQPVETGQSVGAAKVTPLAISNAVLTHAEDIAVEAAPVTRVIPYAGAPVGVVVRDRLTGKTREKFETAIHLKTGWFGSPVAGISYLPDEVGPIAEAIEQFVTAGVGLILAGGVNSTDPLDLTLQALDRVGARTEKRGVPAHPGSTCWLAYISDIPIFGLALCGMFSKTTVLDLLLPRFLAGRKVEAADLAELGHGGLLGRNMAFRFPDYQSQAR